MPLHLFRNRNLVAGVIITFIFMGTFGALPYFLTILFQNVQGYSVLNTGLAFIIPSLAIAAGTQLGERLATRLGARSTLLIGMLTGVAGTMLIPVGAQVGSSYLIIVPGLIISGIGQGITSATGERTAINLAALGILLGAIVALFLPRKR